MVLVGAKMSLGDWSGAKEYESEVRGYFPSCPLCGSKDIEVHFTMGGRDTLSCESCGARWHIYVGLSGLKWAELDVEADDGTGKELLGKRLGKEEWRRMAHEARKRGVSKIQSPPSPTWTKEKETIIKEIVMIPCKYCGGLMPQTSTFCPHCGAKRTA